jgi:hypothetical protein
LAVASYSVISIIVLVALILIQISYVKGVSVTTRACRHSRRGLHGGVLSMNPLVVAIPVG